MPDERQGNAGAVGVGALLGGGLALLLSRSRVGAATIPADGELDAKKLVEYGEGLDAQLASLNEAIRQLAAASGATNILGLHNPREITSWRTIITAAFVPQQLPSKEIPYRLQLAIKALPTNGGVIYVGNSRAEAANPNSSYILIGNEAIHLEIDNSDQLWISGNVAGEGVNCIVEQAKRSI